MTEYYNVEIMEQIEVQLKQIIMSWPRTSTKWRSHCPAFLADGTMFCLLVTNALILTHISPDLKEEIQQNFEWSYADPILDQSQNWIQISLVDYKFTELLPLLQQAYHETMNPI